MPKPAKPASEYVLKIDAEMRAKACAAQHFGPWMIEPGWFGQAIAAINAGTYKAAAVTDGQDGPLLYDKADGIAIVPISGPMMKGDSSFGGTSTVRTRKALRAAVADDDVDGIVLHIDSPGGTVSGNADLAAEVRSARKKKPVRAHISDMGASAAYWIASQAERITANETALVGSIGTVAVVADSSEMAAKEGVMVHVVSTGKHKGAFAPGSEVTEEQLAELQTEVDDLNEHFLSAVIKGRAITRERLEAIADGRVFIAAKAKAKGLIDAVTSFDAAITSFRKEITAMELQEFQAFAATNPEAALDLPNIKTELGKEYDRGFADGNSTAHKAETDRLKALSALKGATMQFAVEQYLAGHDVAKATIALADKLAEELEQTKAALASAKAEEGQGPLPAAPPVTEAQLSAAAVGAAWDADPALQRQFPNKALYVRIKTTADSAYPTLAR